MIFPLFLGFFSYLNAPFAMTMQDVRMYRDIFHPDLKQSYSMPTVSVEFNTIISDKIIVYEMPRMIINGHVVICNGKDQYGSPCEHIPIMIELDKETRVITAFCLDHVIDNYKGPKPKIVDVIPYPLLVPDEPMFMECECK